MGWLFYLFIGALVFMVHAHGVKRKIGWIHLVALLLFWPLIIMKGYFAMRAERKKRT